MTTPLRAFARSTVRRSIACLIVVLLAPLMAVNLLIAVLFNAAGGSAERAKRRAF